MRRCGNHLEAEVGLTVLLTAGGTQEPIDDVRSIRNVASGALPAAMAEAWLAQGAHVVYLHGPDARLPGERQLRHNACVAAPDPAIVQQYTVDVAELHRRLAAGKLTLLPVQSAADALRAVQTALTTYQPDVVACAMAVADFSPVAVSGKIASRADGPQGTHAKLPDAQGLALQLLPTAKVIDTVKLQRPACLLLGFKLLSGATEAQLVQAARHLAQRSGADAVFANDVQRYRAGIRDGLLVAPDGRVLDRPDGGAGPQAHEALAQQLVAWCDLAWQRMRMAS